MQVGAWRGGRSVGGGWWDRAGRGCRVVAQGGLLRSREQAGRAGRSECRIRDDFFAGATLTSQRENSCRRASGQAPCLRGASGGVAGGGWFGAVSGGPLGCSKSFFFVESRRHCQSLSFGTVQGEPEAIERKAAANNSKVSDIMVSNPNVEH